MWATTFVACRTITPVTTLADRLERLVELSGVSHQQFSRSAGLAQSHVSLIIRRDREKPGEAGVTVKTLQKLAKRGNVSPAWLGHGEGPGPEMPPPPRAPKAPDEADERYVHLPAAMTALEGTYDREIIEALPKVRLPPDECPTREGWAEIAETLQKIRDEAKEKRPGGKRLLRGCA